MSKIEPQAFVEIETKLADLIGQQALPEIDKLATTVAHMCTERDFGAAYQAIDQFHLHTKISSVLEQLQTLGLAAVLFGANQVHGLDEHNEDSFPPEVNHAISQLIHMTEVNVADAVRDALRAAILEDQRTAQATYHVAKYDPDEARDDVGRWTDGGSGGLSRKYQHSKMIDGVIHTADVGDAARALYEGKRVVLTQPREVSTLIDHLGQVAKHMIAMGGKAPTFNLCNVSVEGTNLFCAQNLGIPRAQMPQLSKEQRDPFIKWIQDQGIEVTREKEQAAYLRATQNELNGVSVAQVAMKLKAGTYSKPIFVSSDNYVLDGHHQWAAQIGLDAIDGKFGDQAMDVARVHKPITELLALADKFTEGKGKRDANTFKHLKDDLDAEDLARDGGLLEPEQAGATKKRKPKTLRKGCDCCVPTGVFKAESDPHQSLYVHRPLLNPEDLVAWAEEQGLYSTLDPADMHVTVLYSKTPVEGHDPDPNPLSVEDGYRGVHQFGDATVLQFSSPELEARNRELIQAGGSSDFPTYNSHVTFSYDNKKHVSSIMPYDGPLHFGPEVFKPLDTDWKANVVEQKISKADLSLAEKLNQATMQGKQLFDAAANLTTSRLINFGFLSQAQKQGVTHYQINEILDDRTCPVCIQMHGRIFAVEPEYGKTMQSLMTSDPANLKTLNPWPKATKAGVAKLKGMSQADLEANKFTGPPFHPHCRGFLSKVGDVEEHPGADDLEGQAQDIIDGLGDNNPEVVGQTPEQDAEDAAGAKAVYDAFTGGAEAASADALVEDALASKPLLAGALEPFKAVLDELEAQIELIDDEEAQALAQDAFDNYDFQGAQEIVNAHVDPLQLEATVEADPEHDTIIASIQSMLGDIKPK